MDVSNFPWIILVPRLQGVTELFHLSPSAQIDYQKETNYLLEAIFIL
jgi:diadenosine tetraphosphate (Ap4A) HIT family hydrolase